MDLDSPPLRGRPLRHPVDALRTRLWFHVVKLRSKLPSAYAIEEAIEGKSTAGQVWRPRKWDGYESGRKVPTRSPGKPDAVLLAEERYPGTAHWFQSPIWTVLKRQKMDWRQLEDALRTLEAPVVELLFHHAPFFGEEPALRPRPLGGQELDRLAALGTFDALVATVLLIEQSEVMTSPPLRDWAIDAYVALQPLIADAPETCTIYPELFTYIDRACPRWIYPSPNQRFSLQIFWQEMARTTWARDRMPFIEARLIAMSVAEQRAHPNRRRERVAGR